MIHIYGDGSVHEYHKTIGDNYIRVILERHRGYPTTSVLEHPIKVTYWSVDVDCKLHGVDARVLFDYPDAKFNDWFYAEFGERFWPIDKSWVRDE